MKQMMNRNTNLLIRLKTLKNKRLKFICFLLTQINFDSFMIF